MTKVVFQDKGYWLTDQFWADVEQSQTPVLRAKYQNSQLAVEPVSRAMIERLFTGKIAGWVTCEHKSISVFHASLSQWNQPLVIHNYVAALTTALETVAGSFIARTGAQGKNRIPAEPTFYIAIHVETKNGQPHVHAHIALGDQVRVPGESKKYATHKVQLYQLRELFTAALRQEFGHRLQRDFGVRIQRTEQGLLLPDVPKVLCEASSERTKQIDQFLNLHTIPNTPLTRRYAAQATRRWNPDPQIGRHEFERRRTALGFHGEQITHRVEMSQLQEPERGARSLSMLVDKIPARVTPEARDELLLRVLQKTPLRFDVPVIRSEFERAIKHSIQQGQSSVATATVSRADLEACMKRITAMMEREKQQSANSRSETKALQTEPNSTRGQSSSEQAKSRSETHHSRAHSDHTKHRQFGFSQEKSQNSTKGEHTHGQSSQQSQRSQEQCRKLLQQLWQSTRVVGAVGAAGIAFAKKTIALYQELTKPIWRLEGAGLRSRHGSVAHAVRDLKPQSRWVSHLTAVRAMVRFNGSLEQKLAYGEHVYRQCRRPKFKIPKKSLVVIRDVESALPSDVATLLKKAKRAKARVLLVDREWTRRELVKAAENAPPGKTTRINNATMGY